MVTDYKCVLFFPRACDKAGLLNPIVLFILSAFEQSQNDQDSSFLVNFSSIASKKAEFDNLRL